MGGKRGEVLKDPDPVLILVSPKHWPAPPAEKNF